MEEVKFEHCPKCGKKDFRYRLKTEDYVCNKCGNNWIVVQKGSAE